MHSEEIKRKTTIGDSIKVIVQAILLALIVRSFLIQPFVIPSGSMRPTLLVGDYLFVSKFSYGYSNYSFPFPFHVFSGRLWGKAPQRGDVVVFHHRDAYDGVEKDFIKRVIGLPGDRIQVTQGVVYINGKAVIRKKLGQIDNPDISGVIGPADLYQETLPNGVTYHTLDIAPASRANNTQEFCVPAGHYFMMGDNRDNSEDSRFSLGYIADDELIGKGNMIFFSLKNGSSAYQFWRWPFDLRFNRLFSFISQLHKLPFTPEKQAPNSFLLENTASH